MRFTIGDLRFASGARNLFREAILLSAIFYLLSSPAQTPLEAPGLAAFKKTVAGGGGGGGGTYSLIAHATANGGSSGTTAGTNTTGANLIIISASWFSGAATISDNKGNTYTALAAHGDTDGQYSNQFYYCVSPTVGSGHTFTLAAAFGVINVAAFSLSSGTPAFDTQNGLNFSFANTTSFQPGSVAPAGNNELFVTSAAWNQTGVSASIGSSFIITDQAQQGANALSGALAYKIQTAGGSENPTWTFSGTINAGSSSIAVFK
jgi:hypothetical protein